MGGLSGVRFPDRGRLGRLLRQSEGTIPGRSRRLLGPACARGFDSRKFSFLALVTQCRHGDLRSDARGQTSSARSPWHRQAAQNW